MKHTKSLSMILAATLFAAPAFAATFEVEMLNSGTQGKMVFEPYVLKIAVGDTINFIATDRTHNAATIKGMAPEGSEKFKGKISKDVEVTFTEEGWYGVQCVPHFALGMVMTVQVGDAPMPEDFLERRLPPKAKKRFEESLAEAN